MRFVVAVLLLLSLAGRAAAQDCTGHPGPLRLHVDVGNVRSSAGLIAVTLYPDDRRRFLAHRGSLYVGRVPAAAGTTRVCVFLPGPGAYAIAVYHDADANRHINRNVLGMPSEGYGFSNNAPALFGLPSFSRVRLTVRRNDMTTSISLHYP